MAEYLSPGVYVEDFDNTPRAMEGVGTDTAGFVGLAEKGSTSGKPVFVENYAEFTRRFGGYLSESEFGEYRYLSGAVELFFQNGGRRCYVARVIPNDAVLWERVRNSIEQFLNTLWSCGMFSGATQEDSYFVEIGPSTMTEDDIRNGRLICNIGIAPIRPAEFLIFRVTQRTSEAGD